MEINLLMYKTFGSIWHFCVEMS